MRTTNALAAALLILLSAAVSAQDARPPAEIGAGYGGLLVTEIASRGGDYTVGSSSRPAIDFRVTVPYTPRFSFEALATISSRTSATAFHLTNGLYILQVKQRLRSATGERFHAFLTYGATGYYAHLRQEAATLTGANGKPYGVDAYEIGHTDPPFFAIAGGGFQREVGHWAAVRADAQLVTLLWVPVGVRLSAGISIPFEEYGATAPTRTR